MNAAIYARKSTEQSGVVDEAKSVTRQVEHAKGYAVQKGWMVAEEYIYVDDGISGAEFAKRPGLVRLLAALTPRPPFQVLVMSEESRLGREQIETAYLLKQIITAGVRVFYYLEDKERTLDSPTDKILLAVSGFADEVERDRARQRTRDGMVKKAKAGHVTGGRKFGYENVEILGPNGERSHVDRRVNPIEAAVVLRIFRLVDQGWGIKRIAHTLNAEAAPTPGHTRVARPDGPPRRCARSSGAGSTAGRSSGAARRSGTPGGSGSLGRPRAAVPRTTGFESTGRISASSQKTSGSPCRRASASRAGRTSDRMTGASWDAPSTGSRRSTS
jgi:DNA invertase Pin-like site-specific DNA recombinase